MNVAVCQVPFCASMGEEPQGGDMEGDLREEESC